MKRILNLISKEPLFLLALLLFLTAKGHLEIIDTDYSVRTAIAIIEDGTLLIEPVVPEWSIVFQKSKELTKFILNMALA